MISKSSKTVGIIVALDGNEDDIFIGYNSLLEVD